MPTQPSLSSRHPAAAGPQPQWPQFAQMRAFAYTHTQPQWADVRTTATATSTTTTLAASSAAPSPAPSSASRRSSRQASDVPGPVHVLTEAWTPTVVRPLPLEGGRVCKSCHRAKKACTCTACFVCHRRFHANRHHCRRCWHAVCTGCWGHLHYVHMLGRQMTVCDRCSTPWALANLTKRDHDGLLWGLYVLRAAGAMPRLCVSPSCNTFTRRLVCYTCGLPTVATQPHTARVVRGNGASAAAMDEVRVLDMQQLTLRAMEVGGMTTAQLHRLFRGLFHRYEEVLAFRAITTAVLAQRTLLAVVAAAVAYEYAGAPNLTLALSDIPYARALRIAVARERYTILEAPGRVKFIAFPGTHNWRTRWVDMQFARVTETVWSALHEGVRVVRAADGAERLDAEEGEDAGACVALHGGVRKVWQYQVHKGFAQEAQEVGLPFESLMEDVRSGGYSLVLCGHSLGGAIAQCLSLQLLHRDAALFSTGISGNGVESSGVRGGDAARLLCVSLGAPLLGNYELADHVHSCGWTPLFHNFVYRSDIVPRLSCTDELAWDAQSRLTHPVTSIFAAAQSWWRGSGNSASNTSNASSTNSSISIAETATAVALAARSAGASPGDGNPQRARGRLRTAWGRLRRRRTEEGADDDAAAVRDAPHGPAPLSEPTADSGAGRLEGEGGEADAAAWEAQARLAAFVDTAIRGGSDALEEDAPAPTRESAAQRDADVDAALIDFSSRCARTSGSNSAVSRHASTVPRDVGVTEDEEQQQEDPEQHQQVGVSADTEADVVLPAGASRRMHRRFTCFGRYHFIQYGAYGYVSTDDSETAFGVIKHGCGEASILRDHSVESYNRGVMVHLYRNSDAE